MKSLLCTLLTAAGIACCAPAVAAISLDATRIVYQAKHKEETIAVRNGGAAPVLIQSWVDQDGAHAQASDPDAGRVDAPFVVTPPLARIENGRSQRLRLIYEGVDLPEDRESLAWLNVQEIPVASQGGNVLQIAIRQRIKVFYRPRGLAGKAAEAPATLQWRIASGSGGHGKVLRVRNPSAYHVTIAKIDTGGATPHALPGGAMLAPHGEHRFNLPVSDVSTAPLPLKVSTINDYGGITVTEATAQPDTGP